MEIVFQHPTLILNKNKTINHQVLNKSCQFPSSFFINYFFCLKYFTRQYHFVTVHTDNTFESNLKMATVHFIFCIRQIIGLSKNGRTDGGYISLGQIGIFSRGFIHSTIASHIRPYLRILMTHQNSLNIPLGG